MKKKAIDHIKSPSQGLQSEYASLALSSVRLASVVLAASASLLCRFSANRQPNLLIGKCPLFGFAGSSPRLSLGLLLLARWQVYGVPEKNFLILVRCLDSTS